MIEASDHLEAHTGAAYLPARGRARRAQMLLPAGGVIACDGERALEIGCEIQDRVPFGLAMGNQPQRGRSAGVKLWAGEERCASCTLRE